jgi:hypothetical protein
MQKVVPFAGAKATLSFLMPTTSRSPCTRFDSETDCMKTLGIIFMGTFRSTHRRRGGLITSNCLISRQIIISSFIIIRSHSLSLSLGYMKQWPKRWEKLKPKQLIWPSLGHLLSFALSFHSPTSPRVKMKIMARLG